MKLIILFLSIVGLYATTANANTLVESIDEIKAIVPADEIRAIFNECREDPEIQVIQEYLRSPEYEAAVNVIRNNVEIQEFFGELADAGVDFNVMNFFFYLWGIPGIEFTDVEKFSRVAVQECGGWRGVYERIDALITFEQIGNKINEVYDRDQEFQSYWARFRGAEALAIQIIVSEEWIVAFQKLDDLGVDLDRIVEALNVFFGWEL